MGLYASEAIAKGLQTKNPKAVEAWMTQDYPEIKKEPKKRKHKSIGAMKPVCVTIATMGAVMLRVGKHPLLDFIPDVSASI